MSPTCVDSSGGGDGRRLVLDHALVWAHGALDPRRQGTECPSGTSSQMPLRQRRRPADLRGCRHRLREVSVLPTDSRRAHKASIVLGACILRCLTAGEPLSPLDAQATCIADCKVGDKGAAVQPALQAALDACFRGGPATPGDGDANIIDAATDTRPLTR